MLCEKRLDLIEERRVGDHGLHGRALYDKFPTAQGQRLEIYQIAGGRPASDTSAMAAINDKKADAERRAKALYARLRDLKPEDMSFNQWTAKAGVSTSFFTNMQGNSKPASEPSIGNLRLVLKAVGKTLPEFFLHEAEGRLVHPPTRQAIERALHDLSPDLPTDKDRLIAFVASNLARALALPDGPTPTAQNGDPQPEESAPAHSATNQG